MFCAERGKLHTKDQKCYSAEGRKPPAASAVLLIRRRRAVAGRGCTTRHTHLRDSLSKRVADHTLRVERGEQRSNTTGDRAEAADKTGQNSHQDQHHPSA